MIVEKVITEGAEIYCERRGDSGPLLLLITGAMEDAGFYSSAADILADKFTVVSYDRRCNSRSSGDRLTWQLLNRFGLLLPSSRQWGLRRLL
ncbi:MAG TPA: hypothetical protein VE130_10665 [Nitrososphaeraceae archaeon]|nr:hypothetical protein [Nitrososphaeraceae archaeon]